jgi:hypothetical protein
MHFSNSFGMSKPAPRISAILVYDISRWGRFQDSDESAHYEYICKRARIAVHYCAEPFVNDGSLPSSLLKAIKRTMAAEYSRELSAKVLPGSVGLSSGFPAKRNGRLRPPQVVAGSEWHSQVHSGIRRAQESND